MTLRLLPVLLLVMAQGADAQDNPADITVIVSGIRSDAGRIHVDICTEATFLKPCPWSAEAPARKGAVTVVVRGVPPGRYAVQAYHDANGNGDLDQGIFGIPKEGLGFSHDAMPRLKKPKFAVAAFDHGTTPQRVPVTLHYFLG